jgi:hypothetical protein
LPASSSRSRLVALELSFSSGKSAVQLFLNSWSYGRIWPISISAADHLITKQLLCQLSYAGILAEGYRKPTFLTWSSRILRLVRRRWNALSAGGELHQDDLI